MPASADLVAILRVFRADIDRPLASRLATTILAVIAGGLLAGLSPLALKGMIDAVGASASQDSVSRVPAVLFATAYVLALCAIRLLSEFRPMLIASAEQRLYARLRNRFFAHLLDLPLAFHRDRQGGALVQTLQQAILGYQIVIFNLVNSVVPMLVEIVTVTLVLLALGEPMLVIIFAASALAHLTVLRFHGSGVGSSAREVAEAGIAANGILADGLLNVETVKCFGAEQTTRDRFATANRQLELRWGRFQRARLSAGMASAAIFALSLAALLAIALHSVLHGTLTVGGFVLANVYMLQMARPLELLSNAARDLSQAVEFIRPLMDVLAQVGEAPENKGASPVGTSSKNGMSMAEHTLPVAEDPQGATALSLRDVCFAYPCGRLALDGLSMDIAAGRRVAIVGASGAGKSSLARLLLRLDRPQAGVITLEGRAIDAWPAHELRRLVTVVPQDTLLFDQTIAFNIGIGRGGATCSDIERAARRAQAHAFICALPEGYETVVGERGVKLSGGERQRIAIARAILRNPKVLVLDEATSMLDAQTESRVLQNLRDVSAGVTTVVIAHRLASIQDADEIVVLGSGRVVQQGSHADLLSSGGAYARLWQAQQGAPAGQPRRRLWTPCTRTAFRPRRVRHPPP